MQRHGDLARSQVRAEVPADLPHRVDDVLAYLLRELLQLFVAQAVEIGRLLDASKKVAHQWVRVAMKSVICSNSAAPPGAAWASAARALRCDRSVSSRAPSSPNSVT